jgi:hypothetical protein
MMGIFLCRYYEKIEINYFLATLNVLVRVLLAVF